MNWASKHIALSTMLKGWPSGDKMGKDLLTWNQAGIRKRKGGTRPKARMVG